MLVFSCNTKNLFTQKESIKKYSHYTNSGRYQLIYFYPNYHYVYLERNVIMIKSEGTWKYDKQKIIMISEEAKIKSSNDKFSDTLPVSLREEKHPKIIMMPTEAKLKLGNDNTFPDTVYISLSEEKHLKIKKKGKLLQDNRIIYKLDD
jgi:hypothetical protein